MNWFSAGLVDQSPERACSRLVNSSIVLYSFFCALSRVSTKLAGALRASMIFRMFDHLVSGKYTNIYSTSNLRTTRFSSFNVSSEIHLIILSPGVYPARVNTGIIALASGTTDQPNDRYPSVSPFNRQCKGSGHSERRS